MSTTTSLQYQSIAELHAQLQNRTLTCKDLILGIFSRIEDVEPHVRSYLALFKEDSIVQADRIDALYDKGDPLPILAGIPVAIKDNICIQGQKTTCASKILESFVAPYNATVINKLAAQHMIVTGKTNMDEFAMGSSTENSAFQTTHNPWHLDYAPGGSSGGSATAVSAGEAIVSLGSDTGGSIRQPASFCGLVGLKPTYGRVSRYGLVAFASSLDQIGPFSRTIEDAAHLLQAISGHDPNDATSAEEPVPDFVNGLGDSVKGLKIAVPKELFDNRISDDVKEPVTKALDLLKKEGASWDIVSMSSLEAAIATYYVIAPAEASSNLSRYDGVRYTTRAEGAQNLKEMYRKTRGEGFGSEVKRRILLGTFALSSGYYDAYYLKAQKVRTLIKQDFDAMFANYDVVLSPTTPSTAFKLGEKVDNPMEMYLSDLATIPANMAGLPGLSIPCGFSKGLPVGLQLVGKTFDESTLLTVGHVFQGHTDFHLKQAEVGR